MFNNYDAPISKTKICDLMKYHVSDRSWQYFVQCGEPNVSLKILRIKSSNYKKQNKLHIKPRFHDSCMELIDSRSVIKIINSVSE